MRLFYVQSLPFGNTKGLKLLIRNNIMKNTLLPDTQNTKDLRNIVINQVGIKDIKHPINFINRDNESFPSIGNFTMTVRLPENVKGCLLYTSPSPRD